MIRHRPGTQALDRAFALLRATIDDGGASPLSAVAGRVGMPAPTAYRIAGSLVRSGLLAQIGRGRYTTGLALFELAARRGPHDSAIAAARPLLRRVAAATGRTAHLGTFDGEMVTYLVREAPVCGHVFTREGGQLEAYCSAIGKVLLMLQSSAQRDCYLAAGGFVALTPRTIINGETLRAHLATVAADGFALDDEEVKAGLFCFAVPINLPITVQPLALSLAGHVPLPAERPALLAAIRTAAAELGTMLGVSAAREM